MKLRLLTLLVTLVAVVAARGANPPVVAGLMDRIDTSHTLARRIATRVDPTLATPAAPDVFVITARRGRPLIEGSNTLAVTTGLNWYLNHYAHVNLSWNQLAADLSDIHLPLPLAPDRHTCDADYRYYLNYCTFGYSMATWTWERWQQEIDWMALHGINMPLQIVGLEEVWRRTLRRYNYSDAEAKAFAAGPAFTAWWGMNNLEGWGGTQDDAWFERQARLGRDICDRMRQFGMQPVLPGFASTVPHDFTERNPLYSTESQGNWGRTFVRPYIMDPTSPRFAEVAATYYAALTDVLGPSRYYSMDPFHEGGSIKSGKYAEGYRAIFDAMDHCCGPESQWVIQQWQWAKFQATCLTAVPEGRLIVLDLFSDGRPDIDRYAGYAPQHGVYCTIPNFGGRTGLMARLPRMARDYYDYRTRYATMRGIGAAPEAIEQTPVAYDLLFELPWTGGRQPDVVSWIDSYVMARYHLASPRQPGAADALAAWHLLLATALGEHTGLQGPHEAVMCGRPALTLDRVSAWGGSEIYYDTRQLVAAARHLLAAADAIGTSGSLAADNMSYDLCDIVRQCMSDRSKALLGQLREAHAAADATTFAARRDDFLQLILDTDRLLGTNSMFRLGRWTATARAAALEVHPDGEAIDRDALLADPSGEAIRHTSAATPDWYELDNARTLITTWGDHASAEWGLRDYSYRQWHGLLADFYYPRWRYWFDHDMQAPPAGWFFSEWNWAHELQSPDTASPAPHDQWGASGKGTVRRATPKRYTAAPEGDTKSVAADILRRFF